MSNFCVCECVILLICMSVKANKQAAIRDMYISSG